MKRHFFLTVALIGMLTSAGLAFSNAPQDHSHEKNAFTPDSIPWGPAPPVVRPEAQFAFIEGDLTSSTGDHTTSQNMKGGFRIVTHCHTPRENDTDNSST